MDWQNILGKLEGGKSYHLGRDEVSLLNPPHCFLTPDREAEFGGGESKEDWEIRGTWLAGDLTPEELEDEVYDHQGIISLVEVFAAEDDSETPTAIVALVTGDVY